MAKRLEDFASDIRIPEPSDDEGLLFKPDLFPEIPRELDAPGLVARVGIHYYNRNFSLPLVSLMGSKPTMRGLGLLLLAHVFRGPSESTRVFLAALGEGFEKERNIPELRVDVSDLRPDEELPLHGVQLKATAFNYWPDQPDKHPWWREPGCTDPWSLPQIDLGDEDGYELRRPDGDAILYGFGTIEGTIRFAGLLLDISREENSRDEFDLEGEPGFRGVAPASAELRLCLPGNLIYEIVFGADDEG